MKKKYIRPAIHVKEFTIKKACMLTNSQNPTNVTYPDEEVKDAVDNLPTVDPDGEVGAKKSGFFDLWE